MKKNLRPLISLILALAVASANAGGIGGAGGSLERAPTIPQSSVNAN